MAAFVWKQESLEGTRPPWREVLRRWNAQPQPKPFKSWRVFRTYFVRGEEATPPRYRETDDELTGHVKAGAYDGFLDDWVASFRE